MRLLPFVLVLALAAPRPGISQAAAGANAGDGPEPELHVTAFAGTGLGLTSADAWGGGVDVRVFRALALTFEYAGWSTGTEYYCVPESAPCGVRGRSILAGLQLKAPERSGIRPFAEVLGGRHFRSQSRRDYPSTSLALGAGADVRLGWNFSLRLGLRYMRPFDDDYAVLAEEDLSYTVAIAGLRYRLGW